MNAICFSVVILQGPSMLGIPGDSDPEHNYLQNIYVFISRLGKTNTTALIISACCLTFMFGFAFFKTKFPNNPVAKFFPVYALTCFVDLLWCFLVWFSRCCVGLICSIDDVSYLAVIVIGTVVSSIFDLKQYGLPVAGLPAKTG